MVSGHPSVKILTQERPARARVKRFIPGPPPPRTKLPREPVIDPKKSLLRSRGQLAIACS